jgi:hypothetical protein
VGAAMAWCAWLEKHPDASFDVDSATPPGVAPPTTPTCRETSSRPRTTAPNGPRVASGRGGGAFLRDSSGTSHPLFRRGHVSCR